MPLTETHDPDPEVTAKVEEIIVDKETSSAGVASEWATAQADVDAAQSWIVISLVGASHLILYNINADPESL